MNTIYTVGYGAGWTPAQLAAELERLGAVLWDIRKSPTSRRPAWRGEALHAALGRRYVHMAPLGNDAYLEGYIELVNPDAAIEPARRTLERSSIALLCGCSDVRTCHRREAAERLSAATGAPIVHLEPPALLAPGLRALSLQQPMAWAVFHAAPLKDVENRNTLVIPRAFRGRIAIHASGQTPRHIFEEYCWKIADVGCPLPDSEALVYGAILGTVEVVDCVTAHPSPWFVGAVGYVLANPRPLATPIECKGALGFWEVPAAIVPQLEAA